MSPYGSGSRLIYAMKDWIIIDGYNLLGCLFPNTIGSTATTLVQNRKNLLILLEPLVNLVASRITVVYDGTATEPRVGEHESEIIEVIYTPPNISADLYIENLIWKAAQPNNILVVTSVRMERAGASASGADTMSASLFKEKVLSERIRISNHIDQFNKAQKAPTIGDLFDISSIRT